MRAGLELGPFTLRHPLGRGGMGEVWAATHRATAQGVAIKGVVAATPQARRDFAHEVEAMAALHHGRVVWIFDHGVVEERAWLAMELASGGSLAAAPPDDWAGVAGVALAMLEGLAHAHAAGLLHRDVKPQNVLMGTAEDLRKGWRLADFGLAWALRDGGAQGRVSAGSPPYMAPEVWAARTPNFGPGTDLYAVGCVVWELVTGRPPFAAHDLAELGHHHTTRALPDFAPTMAVPAGLEGWLHRLLAKAVADRPERAADAAWWLTQLGDASPGPGRAASPPRSETFTWAAVPRVDAPAPIPLGVASMAPIPWTDTWESGVGDPAPLHAIVGAGLGVVAVRAVPFVGRRPEREQLWQLLGTVVRERTTLVVAITGIPGMGTRRLATWLARRADEVGLAAAAEGDGTVRERLARRRPRPIVAVVHEPDRGWLETLRRNPTPVLVLCGHGSAADADHVVHLDPLPWAEALALGQALLGMEEALVQRLASICAGRPGPMIATVRHWAQAGILVPTTSGFGIPSHAELVLPASSAEVAHQVGARAATLLRAVGPDVERDVWRRAASACGVDPEVLDQLEGAGLAEATERGWRHVALPEGRTPPDVARAVADALEASPDVDDLLARRGLMLAVFDPTTAARVLLEAGRHHLAIDHPGNTLFLTAVAADCAAKAIPASDDLHGDISAMHAVALTNCGRAADALERLGRIIADADQHGWHKLRVPLVALRGRLAARLGHPEDAAAWLAEALAHPLLAPATRSLCLRTLAGLHIQQDDAEAALGALEEALSLAGSNNSRAATHNAMAYAFFLLGRFVEAEAAYRAAIAADPGATGPDAYVGLVNLASFLVLDGRPAEGLDVVRHILKDDDSLRIAGRFAAEALAVRMAARVDEGDMDGLRDDLVELERHLLGIRHPLRTVVFVAEVIASKLMDRGEGALVSRLVRALRPHLQGTDRGRLDAIGRNTP